MNITTSTHLSFWSRHICIYMYFSGSTTLWELINIHFHKTITLWIPEWFSHYLTYLGVAICWSNIVDGPWQHGCRITRIYGRTAAIRQRNESSFHIKYFVFILAWLKGILRILLIIFNVKVQIKFSTIFCQLHFLTFSFFSFFTIHFTLCWISVLNIKRKVAILKTDSDPTT